MPRRVTVTPDAVRIEFTGLSALAALKRELVIPREAIRAVSTEPFEERPWRLAGTHDPIRGYRAGHFRRGGRRYFLSVRRGDPTLRLDLDREKAGGLDTVVVGLDEPQRVRRELGFSGESAAG
jgi:hypothetical protein